jgi:uncharacterized protein YbjT (DUF2867 family)
VKAARFCKETGCSQFLLVSSVGADKNSSNFYLRLKGEVEDAIFNNSIPSMHIFRPSLLLGKRREQRSGEKIAQTVMPLFSFALFGKWSKYKPIEAENVAKAMISASKSGTPGHHVYEYADLRKLIRST